MTSEHTPSPDDAQTMLDGSEPATEAIGAGTPEEARPTTMLVIRRLIGRGVAKWRPMLVMALVIIAMGFAVGFFFLQYIPDRKVDDAAAHQAIRAASDGAVASLSYSVDSLDRDFAKAKTYLTGDFLAYYNKFTEQVVTPMVQQKRITQKAAVVRAAVSELRPDSAVVLVFVNETVTSKDKPQPLTTPSGVRVTVMKLNGSWLISKLDPL